MQNEDVNIRLNFNGEDAKKFIALRDKRGLTINNELIRQLLNEAYQSELSEAS